MPVRYSSQMKKYTFDNIEVGEQLGPVEGVVNDLKLKSHAFAVDDYGDWYFKDSPFGGRVGHPTLLATDILYLFMTAYDMTPPHEGGLHAKNEIEFVNAVRIGTRVTIQGTHSDKYQKRAQNYRILEGQAVDDNGQVIIRMRATETVGFKADTPVGQSMGKPAADAITGEVPAGAPEVTQASRDVPVGAVLPSLAKQTTLEQSVMFSGFPYGWANGGAKKIDMTIHTDPEDARMRGQPDVIVQGLCSAAFLSEMCTNFFGQKWFTTGRLSTAFLRPVIVGDVITTYGMVKRLEQGEGGKSRVHLDVWTKNQRGEMATVGRASAEV